MLFSFLSILRIHCAYSYTAVHIRPANWTQFTHQTHISSLHV